jgi:hypothetical protein
MTTSNTSPRRVTRQDRDIDESQHQPGSPHPDVLKQIGGISNDAVPSTAYEEVRPSGRPRYSYTEPKSQSNSGPGHKASAADQYPQGSPGSGRSFLLTAPASNRAAVLRDLGKPAPADPSQGPARPQRLSGVRGNDFDRDPLWSRRQRQGHN